MESTKKPRIKPTPTIKPRKDSPEESTLLLSQVVDFLPDPTFAIDKDGHVIIWNRAMEKLTRISAKEMMGKSNYEHSVALYGERRPVIVDLALKRDHEIEKNYTSILRQGESIYAESTGLPMKRCLWIKAGPIYDKNGHTIGAIETLRDITDSRLTEDALKKSEAKFRDIFLNVSDYLYLHDLEGNFIETNMAFKKNAGYSEAEITSLSVKDLLPQRHKHRFGNYMRNVMDKGFDEGFLTIINKNGVERVLEYRNSLVTGPEGNAIAVRGSARDITARLRTQRELKKERDFITSIIQTSPAFYDAVDPQGKTIFMNEAMLSALGYKLSDVVGKDYLEKFIPEEEHNLFLEATGSMISLKNPIVHENRVMTRDGRTLSVQWQGKAVFKDNGELEFIFGIGINVTEHRRAEGLVSFSEKKFQAAFDSSPDPMCIINPANRKIIDANTSFVAWSGYIKEEIIGRTTAELGVWVNKDDPSWFMIELINGNNIQNKEVQLKNRSGEVRGVLLSATLVDVEGTSYIFLLVHDITDLRRAEEKLKVSEERFRKMAESSPEIFWITLPDWTKVIYVSPAFERISGIPCEELYKNPALWLELIHPDDIGLVLSMAENTQDIEHEYEFRYVKKDGSIRWIRNRRSSICNEQGSIVYLAGIADDITERKQAEEERRVYEARLMRSQKLEAIGTLAGGIAHDFNNILSAIIGNSELLQDEVLKDSTAYESVMEVFNAGCRAKELVKQILTFSRQVETERSPCKIHYIIKESLKLLRSSIPSTITITDRISPSTGFVLADSTQIHQIIMNLCTNAYHAMLPHGGTLTVSLEQMYLDALFSSQHPPLCEGEHLRLTVNDTGCGMDSETIKRIFDPFFTTKEKGQGTGLGLSTVHGIVTSLGGAVFVSSAIGKSSTFDVYLPVFIGEPEELEESEETPEPGNGETILLVDDEEVILNYLKTMLVQLGYKVTGLSSSTEALALFQSAPEKFNLVITDQTMPGMTGSALACEILKIRRMPIILMSGYSETITPKEVLAQGIEEYIEKPFTRSAIARAIRMSLMAQTP
jgi:PAS domain S-box-containing protein